MSGNYSAIERNLGRYSAIQKKIIRSRYDTQKKRGGCSGTEQQTWKLLLYSKANVVVVPLFDTKLVSFTAAQKQTCELFRCSEANVGVFLLFNSELGSWYAIHTKTWELFRHQKKRARCYANLKQT